MLKRKTDYPARLAPEHPFPTAVNDSWDALKWAAANASSLAANPKLGFIVGGASAGGNLTAVMTHLARDEGLSPPLTGQYLCCPALLHDGNVPEKFKPEYLSRTQNDQDPVLKVGTIDLVLGELLYAPYYHTRLIFNPAQSPSQMQSILKKACTNNFYRKLQTRSQIVAL